MSSSTASPTVPANPHGDIAPARGLRLADVHKRYTLGPNVLEVLTGASAAFEPAAATMIQGASGTGKSTLLHLLAGLDRPDAGRIEWHGENIQKWGRSRLTRWRQGHVGFIFQNFQLLPEFSALENVEMPALLARRGDPARGAELLERVGLGERRDHRPNELSGGEQQRVAIARALRNDPEVLLADEPTGNLDAHTGQGIMDLLLELAAGAKKTLIVVTHDNNIAARGQKTLYLHDGRLHGAPPPTPGG
ncbi:MAG: ABC transporter ATP-binding protein [Verrucomicrobiota bacterium]